ncbi:MAG TPA: LysM peptidoglycan-binding domain-containing protein [Candidatus Saccharibacteria bacterium]|nr:LysM peptidoglycan-binding domain-containing protein [Candidatus Saccharibacteria bacterium]
MIIRKSKFKIKPSTVVVYVGFFALVVSLVSVGYHEPKKVSTVANTAISSDVLVDKTSVDDVVETAVAADVAQVANLPIANMISNLAVSTQTKSEYMQIDTTNIVKPQIIESTIPNRSVIMHDVKEGETIDTLTAKYGISKQTIKWANNKTSDSIGVGEVLKILPIDGVLYTVKSGDTAESIAKRYDVDQTRVILYNDLEVSGLLTNTEIILPNGVLPNEERPGYVAPSARYNYGVAYGFAGGDVKYLNSPPIMSDAVKAYLPHLSSLYQSSPGNPMNTWYTGQCTWWAWERRVALGRPLPYGVSLGNGGDWAQFLKTRYDYWVDKNPKVGAVFESPGHVGIVERFNYDDNGNRVSLTTSEMNWDYVKYLVVERTIPASNFSDFNYIHNVKG